MKAIQLTDDHHDNTIANIDWETVQQFRHNKSSRPSKAQKRMIKLVRNKRKFKHY